MGEAGVFAPEARLELIEGDIVEMAPIRSQHAGTVNALNGLFSALGEKPVVSVQNPIVAGERSVPQPDLAVLRPRPDEYFSSHPFAADILLVVEGSDTSLGFDLSTKVPLSARAGVAQA